LIIIDYVELIKYENGENKSLPFKLNVKEETVITDQIIIEKLEQMKLMKLKINII